MTTPSDIFDSRPLILGSRASALALAQADIVRDRLAPLATDILSLTTRGDRILDRSLADAGGKGLFVKELERQLLDGNCDAAVHSMKDMETVFADGTAIAAVLPREDRRDALIGPFGTIDSLPHGAVVGTASVRRRALLHHHRPDLRIELLRGNVNTRLAALAAGRYDAIILAMAGLRRLALDVPHTPLDPVVMPPAAAQGALAIQIRGGDDDRARAVAAAIAGLNCARAEAEVTAERAMLAHLDGSCHTPIAASATFDDNGALHLDGMVLRPDGTAAHRATGAAPPENAAALGRQLGARLL
ncbi:MAG: hydroxymethylbilane synthase, partial [Rhodobiaceae bacterium]